MGETKGIPRVLLNKIGLFLVLAILLLAYLLMSSSESPVHYSWMIPVVEFGWVWVWSKTCQKLSSSTSNWVCARSKIDGSVPLRKVPWSVDAKRSK